MKTMHARSHKPLAGGEGAGVLMVLGHGDAFGAGKKDGQAAEFSRTKQQRLSG